jgi:hypothetical protein
MTWAGGDDVNMSDVEPELEHPASAAPKAIMATANSRTRNIMYSASLART